MAEDKRTQSPFERHEVSIINRQMLHVKGVVNVESFDAQEFVLETHFGLLAIRGENLHIKTLNLENGVVIIEGVIFDVGYFDEGLSPTDKAKGFLGKLFR